MKEKARKHLLLLIMVMALFSNTMVAYAAQYTIRKTTDYGDTSARRLEIYNDLVTSDYISVKDSNRGNIIMWYPVTSFMTLYDKTQSDYIVYIYDEESNSIVFAYVYDENKEGGMIMPTATKVNNLEKLEGFNLGALKYNFDDDKFKISGYSNTRTADKKATYLSSYIRYDNIVQIICRILEEDISDLSDSQLRTLDSLFGLIGNSYTSAEMIAQNLNREKVSTVLSQSATDGSSNLATLKVQFNSFYEFYIEYSVDSDKPKSVTVPKLDVLLTEVDGRQASTDEYPNLVGMSNSLKEIVRVIRQQQIEGNNSSAGSVTKTEDDTFKELTAYGKWSNIAINYINTGLGSNAGLGLALQSEYAIPQFAKWVASHTDNSKTGSKTTLNDEEVLRLKAYMYVASTQSGNQAVIPDGWEYPSSGNQVMLGSKGYSTSTVKTNADKAIKDTADRGVIDSNISAVVQNFDVISQYITAKIYGYTTGDPFTVSTETNEDILQTSHYIESLIPGMDESLGIIYYPVVLNRAHGLQYIGASQDAYESYLQLQYLLMIVSTYSDSSGNYAGLTLKDESDESKGYRNVELDEYIEKYKLNPAAPDMSDRIANYVNSYISIAKGLSYLQVEPYTEKLKTICGYYNDLVSFESSPNLINGYSSGESTEPLSSLFSIADSEFSYFYKIGVALSATYVPMQTNVYDVSSMQALQDTDFIEKFHYALGFYRKALYIDTDNDAAVEGYVSGKRGSVKVATLSDLLSYEKDIVLYIDDNFYNVNKLAQMQGYSYSKLANTEDSGEANPNGTVTSFLVDKWSEWQDTSIENITKTGSESRYSVNVKKKSSEFNSEKITGTDYILSDEAIKKYMTLYETNEGREVYNEYTPLQSFAVVSSIYRHSALYNIVSSESKSQAPVFVSSPSLAGIKGVKQEQWNSIFNYYMLKNLKGNMSIDYKTTLDLDSPIYIDIYGNILTESGYVIIPAMSNATLQVAAKYDLYTVGFLSLYDNGESIPADYNNSETFLKDMFYIDEDTGTWEIKNKTVGGYYINFRDLPVSDGNVMQTLQSLAQQSINNGCLTFNKHVYLITEALRGAPIENINKEFEGISRNTGISKYGIYFAYKLDELCKQFLSNTNGNTLLSLPNIAYIGGIENVVLFAYKTLFAVSLLLLFIKVYKDVLRRKLGISTMVKSVSTLLLFIVVTMSVPMLMDFSYYQVNKLFLKNEVQEIAMLNLEKKSEGKEIGVLDVTSPESQTTLYLKVDQVSVPWYKAMDLILVSDAFDTMSDIYSEAFEGSLMGNLPGFEKKGNGIYVSLDHLFETTNVEFSEESHILHNVIKETPYASYVTPYYAILDQMIARINKYNDDNNTASYALAVQGRGNVRTKGLIESYFASSYFMEQSEDVLGLKAVYGLETMLTEVSIFTESDISKMQESLWYRDDLMDSDIKKYIDQIDETARAFVVRNRKLIGKVSDETFLKVMALSMAVEYNKVFHVNSADSIEIYDIDTRDIMRLSLINSDTVMNDASKSFARFVYDNSGTLGTVVTSFLIVIYFISSCVKPVCIVVILASMIASMVIHRLMTRNENKVIEGYLISMSLLCGVNALYACCLKLSMLLPNTGVSVTISALFQILIQIGYMALVAGFTVWILKDWRDLGYNKYTQAAHKLQTMSMATGMLTVSKLRTSGNPAADSLDRVYQRQAYRGKRKTRGLTGRDYYRKMLQRDRGVSEGEK